MTSYDDRQRADQEITCIQDVIGHDGIGGFMRRAIEVGRGVVGEADEEGARHFAKLFEGSYELEEAVRRRGALAGVHLPQGFVNVEVREAETGRRIGGAYDDGRRPVRAQTVASLIRIYDPVYRGAGIAQAEYRTSATRGLLEIAIRLTN